VIFNITLIQCYKNSCSNF